LIILIVVLSDRFKMIMAMTLCIAVGNILGITLAASRLVAMFRKIRRAGLISEFVSISPNHKHRLIHIACDGGRVCRSHALTFLVLSILTLLL